MAQHWDVSHELRGEHGKWSKSGVLGRLAREAAGKAEKGELQEGHRVKYKTGSLGVVHHVDEKGTVHVVWDKGRGKPVATPAKHLTRENGGAPAPVPPISGPEDVVRKIAAEERARKEQERIRDETMRKLSGKPLPVHQPKSLVLIVPRDQSAESKQRMRQQVYKATTRQAQITPSLVDETEITVTPRPHGARKTSSTLASHTGIANTLHVKPEVLIGRNAQQVLEANQKSGWWVPGDKEHDLSMNVMTHEFGHGIHGELNRLGIIRANRGNATISDKPEMEFWRGLAKAMGVKTPKTEQAYASDPTMNVVHWHSINKTGIQQAVSRYSGSSLNEMVAEMWTEYQLSSNPRPAAKFFGDYITPKLRLHEQLVA
jgi:hypothetical protein